MSAANAAAKARACDALDEADALIMVLCRALKSPHSVEDNDADTVLRVARQRVMEARDYFDSDEAAATA